MAANINLCKIQQTPSTQKEHHYSTVEFCENAAVMGGGVVLRSRRERDSEPTRCHHRHGQAQIGGTYRPRGFGCGRPLSGVAAAGDRVAAPTDDHSGKSPPPDSNGPLA